VGILRGSLGCDSPPKSVIKGARFWGFPGSRVRGVLVLGGISSIPPIWTSFGGIKLGYGLLMRCCSSPWSNSGDRGLDLGELTRGCCSSRAAQATPV
jgi:hypothetical protein